MRSPARTHSAQGPPSRAACACPRPSTRYRAKVRAERLACARCRARSGLVHGAHLNGLILPEAQGSGTALHLRGPGTPGHNAARSSVEVEELSSAASPSPPARGGAPASAARHHRGARAAQSLPCTPRLPTRRPPLDAGRRWASVEPAQPGRAADCWAAVRMAQPIPSCAGGGPGQPIARHDRLATSWRACARHTAQHDHRGHVSAFAAAAPGHHADARAVDAVPAALAERPGSPVGRVGGVHSGDRAAC
mmetsp:Transcript_19489/g.65411  ORF Transcript_19489/g.65411 Transcript_19489/m.65411 type:complete len:250 (+) Transcript_19489:538-1287(+)